MSQDWAGAQQGEMKPEIRGQVTQLGLDYRLMTQFTSFVAVEDRVVTTQGTPQRIEVPVEMPEGVSYEGVFGEPSANFQFAQVGAAGGVAAGSSGGIASGVFAVKTSQAAMLPVSPPPPPFLQGASQERDKDAKGDATPDRTNVSAQRAVLESKLDPALLAVFDCWKKFGSKCKSVQDGNVEVQVWLTRDSAAGLGALKNMGLSAGASATQLRGRIALEKLEELARMPQVKFVSLVRR